MRRKTKNSIGLLVLLVMVLGVIQIKELPLRQTFIADPVILFVGDLEDGNYGWNVLQGINLANQLTEDNVFQIKTLHYKENTANYSDNIAFPDGIENSGKELKKKLTKLIAEENIIAIISANTSSSVHHVLEVGDTFHIPILLTVATNDQLLPTGHNLTLRLLPKDSLQAKVISQWVTNQLEDSLNTGQTAIFYDARQYGTNLRTQLRQEVGFTSFISFQLSRSNEVSGIIERGLNLGVSNWVLLGYEHQAIEFYSKMKLVDKPINILLSDGSYGEWLVEVAESNIDISFPKTEAPSDLNNKILYGYAPFGYDAFLILHKV